MDTISLIAMTVSPVLIAIIGWFVIRFIAKHDDFKADIYRRLGIHAEKMQEETAKIQEAVKVLHQDLGDSQQIMLNFKSGVQDELYKIKIETKGMVADLKSASETIKSLSLLCEKTERSVADQQKIVHVSAKAIVAHRTEIEKIKSEVVKLNNEMILIKKKG